MAAIVGRAVYMLLTVSRAKFYGGFNGVVCFTW